MIYVDVDVTVDVTVVNVSVMLRVDALRKICYNIEHMSWNSVRNVRTGLLLPHVRACSIGLNLGELFDLENQNRLHVFRTFV